MYPPLRRGIFFVHAYRLPCLKKLFFKIWVFINFTYLCLPKKRGVFACTVFGKSSFRFFAEVAQLVEQLICNQ